MLPRCEHGVYSPSGAGQPSEYCSGCEAQHVNLGELDYLDQVYVDAVIGGGCYRPKGNPEGIAFIQPLDDLSVVNVAESPVCPDCSTPMQIEDEYNLECTNCGFNDL